MDIDGKIEELKEHKKRRKAALKWRYRIKKLINRGIQQKQFCAKYGFDDSNLCHQIAGRRAISKEHFEAVERALKNEGV